MKVVSLYWNNICVLHKGELAFLHQYINELEMEGIHVNLKCFGLGYPEHLSDYLRKPDAIVPDILVSSDLEVFEDRRIWSRISSDLLPIAQYYQLKNDEGVECVYRNDKMLAYVIIPLCFYSPDKSIANLSIDEVVKNGYHLSFGGINNSAGKSIVKLIWSKYGIDGVNKLLGNSTVYGMPVQAYQAVKNGVDSLALVPTIFALNDSSGNAFAPSDGIPVVPSYISARNSVDRDTLDRIMSKLLSDEFLAFFVDKGKLVAARKDAKRQEWVGNNPDFLLPSQKWLINTPPEEFYKLYSRWIPTADCFD